MKIGSTQFSHALCFCFILIFFLDIVFNSYCNGLYKSNNGYNKFIVMRQWHLISLPRQLLPKMKKFITKDSRSKRERKKISPFPKYFSIFSIQRTTASHHRVVTVLNQISVGKMEDGERIFTIGKKLLLSKAESKHTLAITQSFHFT